jgi:hypothetical protein
LTEITIIIKGENFIMAHIIDLTGQKFNRLTVVSLSHKDDYRNYYWFCICDCNPGVILEKSIAGCRLKNGHTKSCGCLKRERVSIKNKSRALEVGLAAKRHLYRVYKFGAITREYEFNISFDYFESLILQNCHYCGDEPKQVYNPLRKNREPKYNGILIYNGIDRIDNFIGYEIYNCVPCCGVCNDAKGTMQYNDFILLIKRIFMNLNT